MYLFLNLLPEILLIIVSLYLILEVSFFNNNRILNIINITLNIIFITIIFILVLLYEPNYCVYSFNKLFVNDNLSIITKIIILISSLIVINISNRYINYSNINEIEYYILIILSILGMFCLVSSNDLISLYISIELISLSFYTLTSYGRTNIFSTEAGLKYFVLGAISSCFLLFGISIIYSFSGATNFNDLYIILVNIEYLNNNIIDNIYILGILFILISLFFKLGVAPFHNWLPDTYQGAYTSITAFFSIVPKISIISIFIKLIFFIFLNYHQYISIIISISCILSILIGTLGALFQKRIKRFLAYCTITHIGYLLIGFININYLSLVSIILYLIIYIINTIIAFSCIFLLTRKIQNRNKSNYLDHIEYIIELKGLAYKEPLISFILAITFFSMASIPPLAGFFTKMYIFMNAINNNIILITILAIILSIISTVYYIRLIKLMYFEKGFNFNYIKFDNFNLYITIIITIYIIIFIFIPNNLTDLIQNLVEYLYNLYI